MTATAVWTTGTFRSVPPEQTWQNIQPLIRQAGITRIADLTHLDSSGVAVHTAARPNAKTLVMAQGKGLTPLLSKVSAVMESLELSFAEQPVVPELRGVSERKLESRLEYPLAKLDLHESSILTRDTELDWASAETIATGRSILYPTGYVYLDRRSGRAWQPPFFTISSNGLASGNTLTEATLHALCEIIERDSVARASPDVTARPVATESLASRALTSLVEQVEDRGNTVRLYDLTDRLDVPCFGATVGGDGFAPRLFAGFGCHPDSAIAALRAVTEAIQNRVCLIAGSRDDLATWRYEQLWLDPLPPAAPQPMQPHRVRRFTGDLLDGLVRIAEAVRDLTGYEPFRVRLTPADCPIQVVRVIAPGLRYHDMSGLR